MSDYKDILGVSRETSGGPKLDDIMTPGKKNREKQKRKKKPEGVSREVFNLIEGQQTMNLPQPDPSVMSPTNGPSVVPTIINPTVVFTGSHVPTGLKEKRKLTRKVRPWVWEPFRNSARKDNAVFYHWTRGDEEHDDYNFARFNKKITMFEYNNEQYQKFFNDDSNWTREETDLLWNMCKQYDLRFVVIADRFPSNKSVDDIKERYYSISKKLLELGATTEEDITKHPLAKFSFNKNHEIERKKQYEKLYHRTKEEVDEEKRLILEYKRIESSLKKHEKDKKRVMKRTQTALSSPVEDLQKVGRGRKKSMTPASPAPGVESGLESPKDSSIKVSRKEKTNGAFARSLMIAGPITTSQKTNQRVDELLVELGIGLRPMPTAATVKAYNELRQDLVALLDLQRHTAAKEYQYTVLKERQSISGLDYETEEMTLLNSMSPPVTTSKANKRLSSSGTGDRKRRKKKDEDKDF